MEKKYYFLSSEGERIEFNREFKDMSEFVFNNLDGYEDDDQLEIIEIPIPKYSSLILKKMIEFYEKYKEKPYTYLNKPLKSPNLCENISDPSYAEWIEKDDITEDILFDLMDCANFFSFSPLLELTCAEAGSMLYKQDEEKKL